MRFLLGCLIGLALATPVSACLNDRNTQVEERQFRSSYQDNYQPEQSDGPTVAQNALPVAVGSVGGVLLIGAFGLVRRAARREQP